MQIKAFFNPYLALGQTRLDTVISITAEDALARRQAPTGRQTVGFIVDISGSMAGEKLNSAKLAARRGIDMLPEQTQFFVVAFNGTARAVVRLCQASNDNKAAAHHVIQDLDAHGGTVMSRALTEALGQVQRGENSIASCYFLTDGENDPGDDHALDNAITKCQGVFQCDFRGIGTDWNPSLLKKLAQSLMGNADAVTQAGALEADFNEFLSRSISKGIAGVKLRLWSPKVVRVKEVKQVSPAIQDLLGLAVQVDDKTLDIPLGAWGAEARDYQIVFETPAQNAGEQILACKPSLIYQGAEGEAKLACDPVAATWSDDASLTTRMSKEVAHYGGQAELAESIRMGLEAKAQGDEDKATRLLGRAAQLAASSGNDEVTKRLGKVVDVVDAVSGTVRLRKGADDKAASMELDMGATRTVRRRAAEPTQASH